MHEKTITITYIYGYINKVQTKLSNNYVSFINSDNRK